MSMHTDEWETVCLLIDQGWPGDFTDAQAAAWRVFLDDYNADRVLDALKALVAKGGRFRPSVAEVVEQIRRDPSRPTFDEALTLWQQSLRAWNLPAIGNFHSEGQMLAVRDQHVADAAANMHPLVASFINRHGIRRLQTEIGELDGDYGGIRRAELQASWEQHLEACEGRDIATLVAPRRGGLQQFDPLAALRVDKPKEITVGEEVPF